MEPPIPKSIPEEIFFVNLFGFFAGWLWITAGIYLQYHPKLRFSRIIPAIFYASGLSILLMTNQVVVREYALGLFLTVVGYTTGAMTAVVFATWLVFSHRKEPPVIVTSR